MDEIFRFSDELGPYKIVHMYEPTSNLKAILVIDNVACGPSIGGVRMKEDVRTEEAFRLARAMTLKNAAACLPHGGGKAILQGDPAMPRKEKEKRVRAFAAAIKDIKEYIPGPDMGTDETCMAWVKDEIGRAVGLPCEIGGIPLDQIGATGFGVSQCVEVALKYRDFKLKGARVAVQGFGSVGKHAARFLAANGAILVAAADSKGTISNPSGLDVQNLISLKDSGRSVTDYTDGQRLGPDGIIDTECEIWIPAAGPDIIDESNVDRLRTKLVVQGANIPFTLGAEKILYDREVLVIPDFIANAGGVICAAVEYGGGNQNDAFEIIEEKICSNTSAVLEKVFEKKILPREAGLTIAAERVKKAMSRKRWSLF